MPARSVLNPAIWSPFAPLLRQYGEECWCDTAQGDTNYRFDMHGSSTSCTMPCSGDASEICGGRWGMSVYKNL